MFCNKTLAKATVILVQLSAYVATLVKYVQMITCEYYVGVNKYIILSGPLIEFKRLDFIVHNIKVRFKSCFLHKF